MAQEFTEAGFLNIVATPHPDGVYIRLLRKAAETPVRYWGDYRAAITRPEAVSTFPGLYSFQLVIWLEVNPNEPAIDKRVLKKAKFPAEGKNFTAQYGVNGRVFTCIFDVKAHRMTVELKNEDGQRVTPGRLEMIFALLLSPEILGVKAEEVEVTVIPTDDAIAYVLGFKRLDKIDILVKRPNDDDLTKDTNRVMRRLMDMKAKSERSVLTRQPKTDGLDLDEEHERLARVAAVSGYVDSAGLDEDDQHGKRSTREVPKIVRRALEKGASYFAALRQIASEAREQGGQL